MDRVESYLSLVGHLAKFDCSYMKRMLGSQKFESAKSKGTSMWASCWLSENYVCTRRQSRSALMWNHSCIPELTQGQNQYRRVSMLVTAEHSSNLVNIASDINRNATPRCDSALVGMVVCFAPRDVACRRHTISSCLPIISPVTSCSVRSSWLVSFETVL